MMYDEFKQFGLSTEKEEVIRDYVCKALERLYKEDEHLLSNDKNNHCSERSIVVRFGYYLQYELYSDDFFKTMNLDCEYNRNKEDTKKTKNFQNGTYPDLIIHKRGNNDNNFLVMGF